MAFESIPTVASNCAVILKLLYTYRDDPQRCVGVVSPGGPPFFEERIPPSSGGARLSEGPSIPHRPRHGGCHATTAARPTTNATAATNIDSFSHV